MFTALKGLIGSKTFWLAIIGSVVITLLVQVLPVIGVEPDMVQTIINWVGAFFGIKGVQQGLADFGKSSPK